MTTGQAWSNHDPAPRWTPGALAHDFGGRGTCHPPHTDPLGDDRAEVACHWPAAWRPIAVAILDLPVPVRDEPAEVSGEVGVADRWLRISWPAITRVPGRGAGAAQGGCGRKA